MKHAKAIVAIADRIKSKCWVDEDAPMTMHSRIAADRKDSLDATDKLAASIIALAEEAEGESK